MRPVVTSAAARPSRRGFLAISLAMMAFPGAGFPQSGAEIGVMTPQEALEASRSGEIILIDIRRPEEWLQTGVAEGAIGLDMTTESFVQDLVALRQANPDTPLAMICRTGNRTGHVTSVLARQGFPGLIDVKEGMVGGRYGLGWLKHGLPTYEGTAENVTARTKATLP